MATTDTATTAPDAAKTTSDAFKALWKDGNALTKFVQVWKEHTDIHACADALGMSPDEASRAAAKLRKAGVPLHNMTRGRRASATLPVSLDTLKAAYQGPTAVASAPAADHGKGKGKGK